MPCRDPGCPNVLRVREGMPRKCAECTDDASLMLLLAIEGEALLKQWVVVRQTRALALWNTGSAPVEVRS